MSDRFPLDKRPTPPASERDAQDKRIPGPDSAGVPRQRKPGAPNASTRSRERNLPDGGSDSLPDVLLLDDMAALLRCSPSTIKRRLRAHVFPVAPLPAIDKRLRWSKAAMLRWLADGGSGRTRPRKRTA